MHCIVKRTYGLFSHLIAISCFLLIFSLPNHASEKQIPSTLTIALADVDYPPFYFKDNDNFSGISIEVLEHIAADLGFTLNYQRSSWQGALNSLKTGKADLITTMFYTEERAQFALYPDEPHAIEINQFITRPDLSISYDGSLNALKQYRIGMVSGYTYGKEYDSAHFLKKDVVNNESQLIKMLIGKRFELAIGNPFAIKLQADRQGVSHQIILLEPAVDISPIYMAISKKTPNAAYLVQQFSKSIKSLKRSPKYSGMLKKYQMLASK